MEIHFKDQMLYNSDGLIPPGGTTGQILAKGSNSDYVAQWSNLSETFIVRAPIGTIVIWSSAQDNIPTGWALCDGQDGRPDLRDKFILCAGETHSVGETGGSEEVTLTVAQMPSHTHSLYLQKSSTAFNGVSIESSTGSYHWSPDATLKAGSSQPHPNMPPYYALCYIIKVTADETDGTVFVPSLSENGMLGWTNNGGFENPEPVNIMGPAGPDGSPIGSIIAYMGTTAPKDYLICDGAEYNISDYSKLAEFFQEQFGSKNYFGGDGTDTFAVPDMRNLFLRGYHGEAEEQLSGGIGEKQESTKIPYVYNWRSASSVLASGCASSNDTGTYPSDADGFYGRANNQMQISATVANVSDQVQRYAVRPVNMAVLYCIKAVEALPAENIYSTEETRIGTWIDGKPLYQVTIQTTLPTTSSPSSSTLLYTYNANVETVVKISGIYTSAGVSNFNMIPYARGDQYINIIYYPSNYHNEARNQFRVILTVGLGSTVFITMQYTKTTD